MQKEILAVMLAFSSLGKSNPEPDTRWLIHRYHAGSVPSLVECMEIAMLQSDEYYKNKTMYDTEALNWFNTIKDLTDRELGDKYRSIVQEYLRLLNDMNLKP